MSITDNVKLVVKVCEMYYKNDLSQKEISAELGISRPQVCRMIAAAKEQGIVSIKIRNPYSEEAALEDAIVEKYGLVHAFVVKTTGSTELGRLECFAQAVGAFMSDTLPHKGRIGVSSGRTIGSVAKYLESAEKKNFEFVPLMGGIGIQKSDFQANQIAHSLADQTNSIAYNLNIPSLVQNNETKKILESEPSISKVLKLGKRCDVTLLGVELVNWGNINTKAVGLTREDVKVFKKLNSVASICTSFIDKDGGIIEVPVRDRIIGQTLEDIKDSKTIEIVVGPEKAPAIIASLKSGYIKSLMTDEATARKLL